MTSSPSRNNSKKSFPSESGWKDQLQALINLHNHLRADGKPASNKTQRDRASYLFRFFREIRELGYKVEPRNIGQRHIRAICQHYEETGLSAATIQTRISFLRVFCRWINKPGMIADVQQYFSNPDYGRRTYQATRDKSWDIPELDKPNIIHQILHQHPYVGHQLLVMDAFGLRRKEAVMLRPFLAAHHGHLFITDGSKGGKPRVIPIEDDYQKEVIQRVIEFVRKTAHHLGDPKLSLKQNLYRFSNVVRQFGIKKTGKGALGVTAHGLRAGFAMTQMEKRGLVPLLRGGEIGALPSKQEHAIRAEVSNLLGHNRTQVTTAYSGPQSHAGAAKAQQQKQADLDKVITTLQPGQRYRFRILEHEINGFVVPGGAVVKTLKAVVRDPDSLRFEVAGREEGVSQWIPGHVVEWIETITN